MAGVDLSWERLAVAGSVEDLHALIVAVAAEECWLHALDLFVAAAAREAAELESS